MSWKPNLRLQKLIISFLLPMIVIVISSCNSTNREEAITRLDVSKTSDVAVQATETLPIIEPTATVTATPEPTATNEPTVTPTETPLIVGDIFFDPQSEADFDKVVKAPSPIDNPDEFAVWQDEYFRQINEKLKTYDGEYMKLENNGIMYNGGYFVFGANNWKVMASYQFPWSDEGGNEHSIINKTFVFKDSQSNKIPVTITYGPLTSTYWLSEQGYETPIGNNLNMYVRYNWISGRKLFNEPFFNVFLPDEGSDSENFDIWYRVVAGISESEQEIEIAMRKHLIFFAFSDL